MARKVLLSPSRGTNWLLLVSRARRHRQRADPSEEQFYEGIDGPMMLHSALPPGWRCMPTPYDPAMQHAGREPHADVGTQRRATRCWARSAEVDIKVRPALERTSRKPDSPITRHS